MSFMAEECLEGVLIRRLILRKKAQFEILKFIHAFQ